MRQPRAEAKPKARRLHAVLARALSLGERLGFDVFFYSVKPFVHERTK